MHLKAFEDFESNAMRLLSDDPSRVNFAFQSRARLHLHKNSTVIKKNILMLIFQTRLVLKYKHSQCRLSLKATDDKQVRFSSF